MELANNLSELSSLSLSSITEVESGRSLSSEEFKIAIHSRMVLYSEHYQLSSGHCVVLLHQNSIEFFIDFLALYFLNITTIPLDRSAHVKDIERVIEFSSATMLIDESKRTKRNIEIQNELKAISLILFTSGTTGNPKGVLISKQSLACKLETLNRHIPAKDIKNTLCALPTFFGHGLICNSLFPLFHGEHFYIAKKMTIELACDFSQYLREKNITFFSTVPSYWEIILGFSENLGDHSLQRVHCASAPLKSEKIKRIQTWLNDVAFYDVYGATEMLGWFAASRISIESAESRFQDFWETHAAFSDEGELLVKSNYMFSGYWKKSHSEAFDANGFFRTGDLFKGHQLVGRSKNLINKNGIKISTDELNSLYLSSQLFLDVASFPVEDNFKGEDIGVFVVLKPGSTLEEFKKFCSQDISGQHFPVKIVPIDQIPVNSRGKVSIELLKSTYRDKYDH